LAHRRDRTVNHRNLPVHVQIVWPPTVLHSPHATADDVPVTLDGRRIDTREKVLAWGSGNNGTESHAKGSRGLDDESPSVSPRCGRNRVRPSQGYPADPLGAQTRKTAGTQTWCGPWDKPTWPDHSLRVAVPGVIRDVLPGQAPCGRPEAMIS
jgi:hypothetical protein